MGEIWIKAWTGSSHKWKWSYNKINATSYKRVNQSTKCASYSANCKNKKTQQIWLYIMTWICNDYKSTDQFRGATTCSTPVHARLDPNPLKSHWGVSTDSSRPWFEPFQPWTSQPVQLKADTNRSHIPPLAGQIHGMIAFHPDHQAAETSVSPQVAPQSASNRGAHGLTRRS